MTATATESTRRLNLVRGDTIKTKRQRWAWEGRIPLGVVTLFAGRGGEGKSTFALHTIAQLAQGRLPGDLHGEPVATLIISHEDDWSTQMIPRLIANGADVSKVYKLGVNMTTDTQTRETVPMFPLDIDLIRDALEQTGARVIVVDPITATIGGNLHHVEVVRTALDPLALLAAEYEVTVIGIMHFNKSAGNVADKVSGSHAFRDVARSLVLFATDSETGKRVISFDKSSYSAAAGSSLEFELESVMIPTDDGATTQVARVANLGLSDVSVSDIVNRDTTTANDSEDRNAAQSFVLDYLKGCEACEAPASDVIKAGRAAGFSEKDMKNARSRVRSPRVVSRKSGVRAGWVWAIDAEELTEGLEGLNPQNAEPFESFASPSPARHLHAVDDFDDPGYCTHGVTIGGTCRQCEGGVAA